MRAALARHGRRMLATHTPAPWTVLRPAPNRRRPLLRPIARPRLHRSFISAFFTKPPSNVRQPEYEPGWQTITEWTRRMADDLRPQPRRELIEAWKKLMQSKLRRKVPLNSTQALQCTRLLEYLVAEPDPELRIRVIASSDLALVREVLLDIIPGEKSRHHQNLAKAMYAVWKSGKFEGRAPDVELHWAWLIKALARYDGAQEAMRIVRWRWEQPEYAVYLSEKDRLVEIVARGLAQEGLEDDLVEFASHSESTGTHFDARLQAVVVGFMAERDQVADAQQWFNKRLPRGIPEPQVYTALARMATRTGCEEWIMSVLRQVSQSRPWKKHWDAILQAAVFLGKTADDVDSIMGNMMDRDRKVFPDVHTLNGLLGAAAHVKDAALGEMIFKNCSSRGVEPDGESCLQLLRLYLEVGDVKLAEKSFAGARHFEPWRNEQKPEVLRLYQQLTSKFLTLLSRHPEAHLPLIRDLLIVADEDQLLLEADAIAAVCLALLQTDQFLDVMNTLASHCPLFSQPQRELVQESLISFCLSADTSTARAWNAYQILHDVFKDTSMPRRERLMHAFIQRKRANLAALVFGHMRQRDDAASRPTRDTYVACLEGLAHHPDRASTQMVHNMLKMDATLDPDTRLFTALILAWTACDSTLAALDCWDEIIQRLEGPSYATLEALFGLLEKRHEGASKARRVWTKMQQMDLEVPPSVYGAYVAAIAGSGHEKEARGLIEKMEAVTRSSPDAMTLGVTHNALPHRALQEQFRKWAEEAYPEAYAKLKEKGYRISGMLVCQFKIQRALKA